MLLFCTFCQLKCGPPLGILKCPKVQNNNLNNDIIIEKEILNNTIANKIYFIGSRPQIVKSEDLFQILKIKFIKSRNNNISIYFNNQ